MIETINLMSGCLGGLALGGFFFGGLWWTVQRALSSPQPAVWFVGSLLLRMSITLTGFHVVSGGQWERLLACLSGFLIARLIITWSIPQTDAVEHCSKPEVGHAH